MAAALKLSLTDVSCSGAYTGNFTTAQYPDQPPQFDALSASDRSRVAVGMGGNDRRLFGTLIGGCTEAGHEPYLGKGALQEAVLGVRQESRSKKISAPFEAALAQIHVLSPKAKVFVLGYPEITPAHGTCPGFDHLDGRRPEVVP